MSSIKIFLSNFCDLFHNGKQLLESYTWEYPVSFNKSMNNLLCHIEFLIKSDRLRLYDPIQFFSVKGFVYDEETQYCSEWIIRRKDSGYSKAYSGRW